MEGPTSSRLTDISLHSVDSLRFVFSFDSGIAPTWQVCLKLLEVARTRTYVYARTIRDALIFVKLGHGSSVHECFSTRVCAHKEASVLLQLQNADEDVARILPKTCISITGIWIYCGCMCCVFWSVNVEDKPLDSLSSSLCVSEPHRTKQMICFGRGGGNEWQVWLFDFPIT